MNANDQIIMYEKEIKALRLKILNNDSHKLYIEADKKRSFWYQQYDDIRKENILLKEKCLKKQKYIDKLKKSIRALSAMIN